VAVPWLVGMFDVNARWRLVPAWRLRQHGVFADRYLEEMFHRAVVVSLKSCGYKAA